MAKGKKGGKQAKGKPFTLRMAEDCVELMLDGRRRLDLSLKELAAVPKCVRKLHGVDELNLSRNLLRKIPDFIEQFIRITVLDLHSNYLEELPVTIGRLQSLQVLNLCNNRLRSLPDELGLLGKLHTLRLGLNLLEALPHSVGALKELRHLGLSDNRFARVPGCLARLGKLEKLNLDRNPIGAGQPLDREALAVAEGFFLVKESLLCEGCLSNCRSERKAAESDEDGEEPKETRGRMDKYM